MADLSCQVPRVYLWSTTHTPRVFVEKLDFRSGMGWGDGPGHRERLGLEGGPASGRDQPLRHGLPARDPADAAAQRAPGRDVDEVQAATGFEVQVDGDVPRPPSPRRRRSRSSGASTPPTCASASWPAAAQPGAEEPTMVKAIYVVYRRPELTREEFAKHWTEVHAPIAEKLPHIRSYTIHPVTAAMEIEGDKEADGFAVCVWDTQEDFEKALPARRWRQRRGRRQDGPPLRVLPRGRPHDHQRLRPRVWPVAGVDAEAGLDVAVALDAVQGEPAAVVDLAVEARAHGRVGHVVPVAPRAPCPPGRPCSRRRSGTCGCARPGQHAPAPEAKSRSTAPSSAGVPSNARSCSAPTTRSATPLSSISHPLVKTRRPEAVS